MNVYMWLTYYVFVSNTDYIDHRLGDTFFICWFTIPAGLKKLGFQKKKKKKNLIQRSSRENMHYGQVNM